MEISYATTSSTDSGTIAVVIGFISIIFLMCLAASIYLWWRIKSPPKREKPSEKLTMSWGEQRLLGVFWSGGNSGKSDPNIIQRLRALRVHIRRKSRTHYLALIVISTICTLYAIIFLLIFLAAFVFQQSWLAKLIGVTYQFLFYYVFIPLFIMLGVACLVALIIHIRLWAIKDNAPIRIINKTDEALKIQIRGTLIGVVNLGMELENRKVLSIYDNYLVEITDISGNIRYSKDLSLDELDETDWNIVIQTGSGLSGR